MEVLIWFLAVVAQGEAIQDTKAELLATQNALVVVDQKMQAMGEDMFDYVLETDTRLDAMQEQIDGLTPTE